MSNIGRKNRPTGNSASGLWTLKEQFQYKNSGKWYADYEVIYLVIAGGGGGGGSQGGGGGAGGYRSSMPGELSGGGSTAEEKFYPEIGTQYTLTVGAGGAGGLESATVDTGLTGSNSVFNTIISLGGGGGGTGFSNANVGGAGGGGGPQTTYRFGRDGTINQGFAGGNGSNSLSAGFGTGGGGGGAGAVGNNAATRAGNGGIGLASSITGELVYRGGGGGGGGWAAINAAAIGGTGGQGGGGAGDDGSSAGENNGLPGDTNTGGGGGGSGARPEPGRDGGNGGSGIVILRVTDSLPVTFSPGVVYSVGANGGYKIYNVTAAGATDYVVFG